jgi:hypothetical protein
MAIKNCWDGVTTLPCIGRERYLTLSHRWLPMAGGDEWILPPHTADEVVNIAHSRKINELNQSVFEIFQQSEG